MVSPLETSAPVDFVPLRAGESLPLLVCPREAATPRTEVTLLVAHGRAPFEGERRVLVGMAEPVNSREF